MYMDIYRLAAWFGLPWLERDDVGEEGDDGAPRECKPPPVGLADRSGGQQQQQPTEADGGRHGPEVGDPTAESRLRLEGSVGG